MLRGLPLAGKLTLLFGGAIVLIVLGSSVAPWLRMNALIDAGQLDVSRQMTRSWMRLGPALPAGVAANSSDGMGLREERGGVLAVQLSRTQADQVAGQDPFLRRALARFERDPQLLDVQDAQWEGTNREYRYIAAVREGGVLAGVIMLERPSLEATRLLLLNTIYLLGSGLVVLVLALLVFWVLTRRLILSPLNRLTAAAERVREGNWAIRSDVDTGDEFQRLGETLNQMLHDLRVSQDRLRALNTALDTQLSEMSESNLALHQAAKLKGEFLANVSHELKTPLNSIVGFAELLNDIARQDAATFDPGELPPAIAKRLRYVENIQTAAKNLQALITSLLDMARIEAGKVQVRIEPMSLRDTCEGLLGLIAPLAAKKQATLRLECQEDLPLVRTDVKKFQQIIFNFLSNAVKFTELPDRAGPRTGLIILRAERLVASAPGEIERVRVSVLDNGPGIPKEEQERIFEKFYQSSGGHTREQGGTGLGLAISKELAAILRGEVQLVSEPGRGSMFSVILPVAYDDAPAPKAGEARPPQGVLPRISLNA